MIVLRTRSTLTLWLCLAACLTGTRSSHAAVISATPSFNPVVGSVDIPIFLSDDVIVQKSFVTAGHLGVVIQVNGPTTFSVTELIDNDSGSIWSDFHWDLLADTATFNHAAIDPFPNVVVESTSIWVDGANVADGGTFGAILFVDASNVAIGQTETITIRQGPIVIPEPSSLTALCVCVIPLICLGRRGRSQTTRAYFRWLYRES